MASDKKPIDRVLRLVEASAPVGDAIRIVLGGSIPRWAATHRLGRTPATLTITGQRVPPDRRVFAALLEDLEATDEQLMTLLTRASEDLRKKALVQSA